MCRDAVIDTMETRDQFMTAQVRKFLTVLFVLRSRRHLKTLAEHYGWSPATLEEYEARFIRVADCVPHFASDEEWMRKSIPIDDI